MKKLIIITALLLFVVLANAQSLEKSNAFTLHVMEIELASEVTMDEFVKFLTKEYIPAWEKTHVGISSKFLKAERSNQEYKFGWLNYYESVDVMKSFYPEDGKSSEKTKKANEKMADTHEKISKFGKLNSLGYTCWVIQ